MFVSIKCPACSEGQINISPKMLADGESFSCLSCSASLKVSPRSQPTLRHGVEEYERLNEGLNKLKKNYPK